MTNVDPLSLCLIDGTSFIFRAFHAVPPLTRKDGVPVNAVLGFTNFLVKTCIDDTSTALAIIFDHSRRTFRHDLYSAYKANRQEPAPELIPQFDLSRRAAEAFNIPWISVQGYEADDLIATYARLGREQGYRVTVVSSDKDLMQLVDADVVMLDPFKNRIIDVEGVIEKFGVGPKQVADVLALAGDQSDNIPGARGIGTKGAVALIADYQSLDNLLAQIETIQPERRRQILRDDQDRIRLSKRLVLLEDRVPLPLDLEGLERRPLERERVLSFLEEQGFRSIISRLTRYWSCVPETKKTYSLIQDLKTLDRWIQEIYRIGSVAVDTETTTLRPCSTDLVGIALATQEGKAGYIPLGHTRSDDLIAPQVGKQLKRTFVLKKLKPLLEDPSILKIGHNLKFDLQVFKQFGIAVAPLEDTMLLSYVLNGTKHRQSLDSLAKLYLNETPLAYKDVLPYPEADFSRVSLEQGCQYAAQDADLTLRLHKYLKPRVIQERLLTLYETIERPLVAVIAEMEYSGIRVDRKVLESLSLEFQRRLDQIQRTIYDRAGKEFNLGSPKQMSQVLFEDLKLPQGKQKKSGNRSTESGVLEELADQGYPIATLILEWRQLSKLRGTYSQALQTQIDSTTGRVHTSFSLAHTSTGRLSSSVPNLQNIPIRTEEGRQIRGAFIADEEYRLVSLDYSQIELRVIAHLADIAFFKETFARGEDIHRQTAYHMFGADQVDADLRRQAKAINFGILYGMSRYGLSRQLSIDPTQAQKLLDQYLDKLPELQSWLEATVRFGRDKGYVTTEFGRRCYVPYLNDSHGGRRRAAERQAINAPVQGTAADITKRAMIRVSALLKREGLRGRMLLQVHDELLFEVPIEEVAATAQAVKRTMEQAACLSVPLVVDVKSGRTWSDMA